MLVNIIRQKEKQGNLEDPMKNWCDWENYCFNCSSLLPINMIILCYQGFITYENQIKLLLIQYQKF